MPPISTTELPDALDALRDAMLPALFNESPDSNKYESVKGRVLRYPPPVDPVLAGAFEFLRRRLTETLVEWEPASWQAWLPLPGPHQNRELNRLFSAATSIMETIKRCCSLPVMEQPPPCDPADIRQIVSHGVGAYWHRRPEDEVPFYGALHALAGAEPSSRLSEIIASLSFEADDFPAFHSDVSLVLRMLAEITERQTNESGPTEVAALEVAGLRQQARVHDDTACRLRLWPDLADQLITDAGRANIAAFLASWRSTGRPGYGLWLNIRMREQAVHAAGEGDIATLTRCLEVGLDLPEVATSLLQAALEHDQHSVLRWFAAHSGGLSAFLEPWLLFRVINKAVDPVATLRLLCVLGADLRIVGGDVLCRAAEYNHLKAIEFLLDHGATEAPVHQSPLLDAARCGHADALRLLLPNLIAPRETLERALSTAIIHRHHAAAQALLDGGADPNSNSDEPPLAVAAAIGQIDTALFLLESGADPAAAGQRALLNACKWADSEMISLLMDHGANATCREQLPLRCLIRAAWVRGHVVRRDAAESLRLLVDRGANVCAAGTSLGTVVLPHGEASFGAALREAGVTVEVLGGKESHAQFKQRLDEAWKFLNSVLPTVLH